MAKYRPLTSSDLVIGEDYLCVVDECLDPDGSWAATILILEDIDVDGNPSFTSHDGYVSGFAPLDVFNGMENYYSKRIDDDDRFVVVPLAILEDESDFLGILQGDYSDITESLAKQWREHVQG